jgi:hypothetical protein
MKTPRTAGSTCLFHDEPAKEPEASLVENPPFEMMKLRVMDRSQRGFQAPPPMTPHGQWSIAESARRYREAHAAIREMLTRPDLDLKAHVFTGGPGTFTLDHWLTLVSLHTRRHLGQIVETKLTGASGGCPRY